MKFAFLAGLLFLLGPTLMAAEKAPKSARAELKDAQGQTVGTATLKQTSGGVSISLKVSKLPAGTHAFHIHAVGKCDPPAFTSAGGHFNPENKKHGLKNPDGPHAGDMPNITVDAKGAAKATVLNSRVTLGEGANSLFHEGGTALIIHEKADDEMTDPVGNAGARIACGVIETGK